MEGKAPKFEGKLVIVLEPDGMTAKIVEPFRYATAIDPNDFGYYPLGIGNVIEVPYGFVTDFASVPQIFWSLVDKLSKQAYPAVIHDYLYTTQPYGRKWADAVFLEALRVSGASWWTRTICWCAVRVAGRKAWDQ